jgi:hypothetical protein
MKIKMTSYMTGAKFSYRPGDIGDFPNDEAERILALGGAKRIDDEGEVADPTLQDVLALVGNDGFEAAARKLLGDKAPEKIADLTAAIQTLADKAK